MLPKFPIKTITDLDRILMCVPFIFSSIRDLMLKAQALVSRCVL